MDNIRANPAPLGLMGFGMTTVLLNLHNAGFFEVDATILAMGIFYGGLAQIIAGIMEFRKGNTFGLTAFTSFGFFWLTLVYILIDGGVNAAFMGWYLFLWGVFTAYMFLATLNKNRALQVVFFSLAVLFFLLAGESAVRKEGVRADVESKIRRYLVVQTVRAHDRPDKRVERENQVQTDQLRHPVRR